MTGRRWVRWVAAWSLGLMVTTPGWAFGDGAEAPLDLPGRAGASGSPTGVDGEQGLAEYLAAELGAMGADPLPGSSDYRHPTELPGTEGGSDSPATARHVIGLLPADETGSTRPVVVLGSRYGSDRFSGAATLLEAGAWLAGKSRRAGVVLAFWSDSDTGGLGPGEFVGSLRGAGTEIAAYVSLDGVDRVVDNRIVVQGVGTSAVWPRLIEQTNVVVGFDARVDPDPFPTGYASPFLAAGVPVIAIGTDGNAETPGDPAERGRVARFASLLALKTGGLEERPDFVRAETGSPSTGASELERAYTGTVPDYAAGVDGLRLSGVTDGGPAALAGLREGDVIVEFAGRKIGNVHDYAAALDSVAVGQPIRVVCLRDGERLEVTVTPTARP